MNENNLKLELSKFVKIEDTSGQISFYIVDKIISNTEFVSDSEIIDLENSYYFKYCHKEIWIPKVNDFCFYPCGKESFGVSKIIKIENNIIYFINGASTNIENVEPFNTSVPSNGFPMFLR